MVGIHHRIGIKAPIAKVYAAISTIEGVAGWWSRETSGSSSKKGDAVDIRFLAPDGGEKGRMTFDVTGLDPDRKVQWRFRSGPEEWIGTDVVFDLKQEGEQTIVLFSHENWRERVEFMSHCSMKWATFLLSLRELVETGAGRPAPHDLKIDNWN